MAQLFIVAAVSFVASAVAAYALRPKAPPSAGPNLQDNRVVGTEYGQPIPHIFGHPWLAPQIIWASAKRAIPTTTTEGGKGGGGVDVTTYSYEVDVLLMFSANPAVGCSRVKLNGKLVYNILGTASQSTLTNNANAPWRRMTFYDGNASQLPDPVYEAAVGSGNAPAYRGFTTMFIEALQLDSGGNLPNITAEIYTAGTGTAVRAPWVSDSDTVLLLHCEGADGSNIFVDESPNGSGISLLNAMEVDTAQFAVGAASADHPAGGGAIEATLGTAGLMTGDFCVDLWVDDGTTACLMYMSGGGQLYNGFFRDYGGPILNIATNHTGGVFHHYRINRSGATIYAWLDGVLSDSNTYTGTVDMQVINFGRYVPNNNLFITGWSDEIRVSRVSRGTTTFIPNAGGDVVTIVEATLKDVVDALLLRSGLSAGQIDTSALTAITKPVRALSVPLGATRAPLEELMRSHFFDFVLRDKLIAVPLGAASSVTIPYADMGASSSPAGDPDPLPITDGNDIEIPSRVAVRYMNIDADCVIDIQQADRLVSAAVTTQTVDVPLGLTAGEAKQLADVLDMHQLVAARRSKIKLLGTYAKSEVTDVMTLTAEDGSTYRQRALQLTEQQGVREFEMVADDASVLIAAGVTSTDYAPSTTVTAPPDTLLEVMDIANLRDVDNDPGPYVAARGTSTPWPGAKVFTSPDDTTYSEQASITESAVMGSCATTLGNWAGGNVFDETNTLTVQVGSGILASVTRDQVLAGTINAALVGGSEIIHFRTATLLTGGMYLLSGLLRGRRGTERAMTGHAANERFVLLQMSGLRRVPMQASDVGLLRYFKGVTLGRSIGTATAEQLVPAGVAVKPWSPVDIRAARNPSTSDITLTWSRRTRFGTNFNTSVCPLGESAEAYIVEIYTSGAFSTVVRTLAQVSSASAAYTSAQQVADFGSNQATVHVRVYQISAAVGRGFPGQASV